MSARPACMCQECVEAMAGEALGLLAWVREGGRTLTPEGWDEIRDCIVLLAARVEETAAERCSQGVLDL